MEQLGECPRADETLLVGSSTSPVNGRAILTTMRWTTPTSNQVCRDFLRNVCQRGARCKYMHFLPPANGFGAGSRMIFCRDYQSGSCRRTVCKFVHRSRNDEEYYNQTGHLPVVGFTGDTPRNLAPPVLASSDAFTAQLAAASGCMTVVANTNTGAFACAATALPAERVPTSNCAEPTMVTSSVLQLDVIGASSLKRKHVSSADDAEKGHTDTPNGDGERLTSANGDLKRKILELETKCRDLAAANELLLEQNARFRIGSSPLPCSSMALSLVQPVYTATTISTCATALSPPAPSASNPNTSTVSVSHSLGNANASRPLSVTSTGCSFATFTPHAPPVPGHASGVFAPTVCSSSPVASASGACRSTSTPSVTLVPSFVCGPMPVPVPMQLHSAATSSANESTSAVQLPAVATTTLNVPVNVPMSVCSVVPCASGAPNVAVPVSVTLSAPVSSCSLMVAQPAVGILSTSLLRTAQIGTLTVVANAHDAHVSDSAPPSESHTQQMPEAPKMPTLHHIMLAKSETQPAVPINSDKLSAVSANENEH